MDDYHIPSFAEWKEQDVMKIKVYQDSQGNKVYGFTDGGEPKESMDGGGGGETWQEGLCRHREEMEMDMLRFEVEDAVLDPDALLDQEKKPKEGAAFGKANVAPASASLVDRPPFVEPFDKGQSRKLTRHRKRLQRKDLDRFHQAPLYASVKEAMDSSQK